MPVFHLSETEVESLVIDFLQCQLPAAPRAYLQQLCKKGKVCRLSGEPLAADALLSPGTAVRLPESKRLLELLAVQPAAVAPLAILYESREILVVDKPAGLAVHASQQHQTDNLTARVEQLLAERGSGFKVAPIHRLDLQTSGPVLFGKGRQACGRLGQLFMQRQVEKFYLALAAGKTAGSGRLESTLIAKGKAKPARTDFRRLTCNGQASLLELQLHTGRQHQIRQQLAQQGHPLFGDRRYRGPCPAELPRLFLHAHRLSFVDPFSGAPLSVSSPLPAELARFLDRLQLELP